MAHQMYVHKQLGSHVIIAQPHPGHYVFTKQLFLFVLLFFTNNRGSPPGEPLKAQDDVLLSLEVTQLRVQMFLCC